jgi:hypothetical protein
MQCKDEPRRLRVIDESPLNGIDYIEVFSSHKAQKENSCLIVISCFKEIVDSQSNPLLELEPHQVRISKSDDSSKDDGAIPTTTNITIRWVQRLDKTRALIAEGENHGLDDEEIGYLDGLENPSFHLVARAKVGDFSQYVLHLLSKDDPREPLEGFDDVFSRGDLQFRIECHDRFDCKPEKGHLPHHLSVRKYDEPEVDYMARDYASIRRLILDRMSLIHPTWKERNPADFGIGLSELLAYVGDHLSYYQDSVATEAYLGTARKRVSVKGHARLLDYFVHEGCNARAWVHVRLSEDALGASGVVFMPKSTKLLTAEKTGSTIVRQEDLQEALKEGAEVFETMHDALLCVANNEIHLYQFANTECWLSAGSTSATLRNDGDAMFFPLFAWEELESGAIVEANFPKNLLHFLQAKAGLVLDETDVLTVTRANGGNMIVATIGSDDVLTFRRTGDKVELESNRGKTFSLYIREKFDGKPLVCALCIQPGDVLLFEEVFSVTDFRDLMGGKIADGVLPPKLGDVAARKHFVKLTTVRVATDKLTDVPIIEVQWDEADAFPFPLCIMVSQFQGKAVHNIVVCANIVLSDHGRTVKNIFKRISQRNSGSSSDDGHGSSEFTYIDLGPSDPRLNQEPDEIDINEAPDQVIASQYLGQVPSNEPFRPKMGLGPITFAAPHVAVTTSATMAMLFGAEGAVPAIRLYGEGQEWEPVRDLLSSDKYASEFVLETESDGRSYARFGSVEANSGKVPAATASNHFFAEYRIGNGRQGNIGAETLARVVWTGNEIEKIRNPEQARGGQEPEDLEEVRRYAPYAFMRQERAVTEEDYYLILKRHPEVQKAKATIRWTGSWYTVFVAIDRIGGLKVNADFKQKMLKYLDQYRLAGYDLEIREPSYVPLRIVVEVTLREGYFRADVLRVLKEVFGNKELGNGNLGFFHPDNFTFGTPVLLSRIYERASEIEGVKSVYVQRFQRENHPRKEEFEDGIIRISEFEIARLDNEANSPDAGTIDFILVGGI